MGSLRVRWYIGDELRKTLLEYGGSTESLRAPSLWTHGGIPKHKAQFRKAPGLSFARDDSAAYRRRERVESHGPRGVNYSHWADFEEDIRGDSDRNRVPGCVHAGEHAHVIMLGTEEFLGCCCSGCSSLEGTHAIKARWVGTQLQCLTEHDQRVGGSWLSGGLSRRAWRVLNIPMERRGALGLQIQDLAGPC